MCFGKHTPHCGMDSTEFGTSVCFVANLVFFALTVCFKVFDVDRDGVLSRDELHEMVVALLEVWKDNRTDTLTVSS